MSLREHLTGAIVLAPLTRGSNLPYRRLCVEHGARVTLSEMSVVRNLRKGRKMDFAILRRAPEEGFFGVQLIDANPEDLEWAAGLAEARGADFVDLNLGCPMDPFTNRGMGAALGRQPNRIQRAVEAMKRGVQKVPVTVKMRLGWNEDQRNFLDQARAAVEGGADALFVHGRTRSARYRGPVDWDAIGEVVAAVSVPVVGNGDILFPEDVERARARSGCVGVMTGRGALIKPWIFREEPGSADPSPLDRLELYRRYGALAREHWCAGHRAESIVREFLCWHLQFWCRFRPRRADGSTPELRFREEDDGTDPLKALLARPDPAAHGWLADRLLAGEPVDPSQAPAPAGDVVDVIEGG